MAQAELEIVVRAGERERAGALVTAPLPPEAAAAVERLSGERGIVASVPTPLWLRPADGGAAMPAQLDPERTTVTFIIPGALAAGEERRLRLGAAGAAATASSPVLLTAGLDRVTIQAGGQPWAVYNIQGGRRPYFWPVLGPAGASVVRGQGTPEHPHHTGMGLAYGGHSEGGSTNIWSDWDEPPYGPGGRMVHRGFRRVASGPVYGELVEDLTYVDAYGEPIIDEVRTIRCWQSSEQARFLDFTFEITRCHDRGPRPFLFAIRLPGSFDVPATGRVTNALGRAVPAPKGGERTYRAAWVDGSGPTAGPPPLPPSAPPEVLVDLPGAPKQEEGPGRGPWNGIAILDHPANDGYPNVVGKFAVVQQLSQVHYPPASAPDGPFTFRTRVYVHAGDAEAARVAERAADYAQPCAAEARVVSGD